MVLYQPQVLHCTLGYNDITQFNHWWLGPFDGHCICANTRCLGKHKPLTGAVALVQWLKLPPWIVGDCGFEQHTGLQVLKKKNVSFPLTCNNSIL